MTYRVVITARASASVIRAFRWKTDHSVRGAARWLAGLERAIARLSSRPEMCPIADEESEILGITIRQMIYGKKPGTYRLLFSIEGEMVVLHDIRHSVRDLIDLEEE